MLESLLALLCFIAISLTYYNIRTGISSMPSSMSARKQISALVSSEGRVIYDLGSGWGGVAFELARANPEKRVVGFELSLFPWLFSSVVKTITQQKNLKFKRTDFLEADLSKADALVCFLYPVAMDLLGQKIRRENLRAKVFSNTFKMPGYKEDESFEVEGMQSKVIYTYRI